MTEDIFKDWDEQINKMDYHDYTCKNCGYRVKSYHMWVRGQTLCKKCYLS